MNEELRIALAQLKRAAEFYELTKIDKSGNAFETGASRDAQEWLRDAALTVAKLVP